MNHSKSKNVMRSTFFGCLYHLVKFIMGLIARKLFLIYIGVEYLSVAQVISSLLTVLSFSEMGIQNAVLFMLYKPVAQGDTDKTRQLMVLYRRWNRYVGCAVFVIGLCMMPFLGLFIETRLPMMTVWIIYMINLVFAASTYFLSYRSVLLSAMQKDYVISAIVTLVSIGSVLLQCVVIYVTKDYIGYLLTGIVCSVGCNLAVYDKVGREVPYIRDLASVQVNTDTRDTLVKNVRATFAIRVCGIVIDNTDNILISWLNTLMVGFCANYTCVTTQIKALISTFQNALLHSLGVANADKNGRQQYALFQQVVLVNTFLAGVITVPLGVLWDDFIVLWIGAEYVIDPWIVWMLLLNFCCQIMDASVWQFRDTTGMFVYVKHVLVLNAALNIVLSLLLGHSMGIAGVYLATVLSNFLTDYWYDAKVVYSRVFQENGYYRYVVYLAGNLFLIMGLSYGLKMAMDAWGCNIAIWLVKGVVSVLIYGIVFYILYHKRAAYRQLQQMCRHYFVRKNTGTGDR